MPRQQKRRNAGVREPQQPAGKLPLVGLRGVASLVRVAGQDHQIDPVGQGDLHQLIQRIQEIAQPRGQTGVGVGATVILHTNVQV